MPSGLIVVNMPGISSALTRPALPSDAAAVDRLLLYLDQVHAEARPDVFRVTADAPRGPTFLADLLADAGQMIVVAEMDGEVVGFVHARLQSATEHPANVPRRYGMIDTAVVLPAMQRRGVGRRLVQAALFWIEKQGVHDQQIVVHAFNESARRLYESLGFAPSFTALRRCAVPSRTPS